MRKFYFLLVIVFSFLGSLSLNAQVNTYIFSQASGTYTPIAGGTVLITATSNTFGNAGFPDDQVYTLPAGTIPFTFTYNGTGYTGLNVSTNAFVTFGATAPAFDNYTPVSSTAGYSGAIAALGRDASGMFNVGGNTSELSYTTEGSSPNREFVIQYKNWRPYSTATVSPYWTWNFQIRLVEGTNAVRIVYGSCTATGTPTASTAQVGLRGSSNADFSNRTSTTSWSATTAGGTNASTVSYSATNVPSSGLTFAWTPPPPCVPGSLAGGTTQSSTASACAGVSFNLTVTAASFGSGLTYQWESSLNGTSWTNIGGATSAGLTTSQSVATHYRRKMTCSGTDAFSTDLTVTAVPGISSFPWTESFDVATIPGCWSNQYVSGTTNWTYVTTNQNGSITPRSGARMAEFRVASIGPSTKLVTPQLNLSSLTSPRLRFYYANVNWVGDIDQLRVYYKTSAAGAWTQIGANYITENILWTGVTLALPNPSSDYYIAFEGTSNWARGLDLDDVTVEETPPCLPSATLSVSGVTTTAATLNWNASTTTPANGYEWELRTSGAAGSGATGLVNSGPVGAGILTTNVSGLTANTQYTFYVRSVCATGVLYSDWSTGYIFRTACDAIIAFPFTETFEAASISRSCWTPQIISGTYNWTYGAGAGNGGVTTAHGGSTNAQFFGASYNGETARLISPQFNLSGMVNGADLEFWMINPSWLGDLNELRVYYRTTAAGAWTLLPGAVYTNAVGSWTKVEIENLPNLSSTYYIAFEGTQLYGYGLGIDDVVVKAAPTCRPAKSVTVLPTTQTTASVYFTSPGNAFIVEYGAPGFTPGTGAAAGTGGTLVLGTASPINISGLTVSTTYDFYIRRVCTPGSDYSTNVKVTATTLCPPTNIPYVQNFESATVPGMPTCTSVQDVNGNSGPFWINPTSGGGGWETYTDTDPLAYVSPSKSLLYFYDQSNVTRPGDDWFYTQGLNLTAGTSYRLKFFYKGIDGLNFPEKLEVKYGTVASATTMTAGTLFSNTNISTAYANPFDSVRVDFTPTASGVYYIGFHAFSDPDEFAMFIDDISVKVTPLVDAGATGLTAIPTCPAATGVMQATIRNYNLTTLNFATYPVTVTATMSGASTGSVNTVVNTGTLAPGASMTVTLPAFNYITGTYNVTVATSSPSDPETANNAYTTSFFVNPSPAAPVITPAAPAICAGAVQLLSATSTGTTTGTITWSPITNLFTTAAANTIYTGEIAPSVYAKPALTAIYTATATSAAGCKTSTPVTVTVNANPVVAFTNLPAKICTSDTLIALAATPVGGTWSGIGVSGNSFIPSRAAAVGTYTLSYSTTNTAGCTTVATIAAKVEDCPERVILLRDNAVIVFPNPTTTGKFNARINSVLYNKLTMRIYNLKGDLVHTQEFSGLVFGRVLSVDVNYLPAGTYMVNFSYDGGVRSADKTFPVMVAH
ncbi:MAG: choice-of-anchor J domain-containing protein [Chitinophagaceae bacterium]